MIGRVLVLALLAPTVAAASPPPSEAQPVQNVGFAINPTMGLWARSGSFYVALGEHHALRANIASYDYQNNPALVAATFINTGGYDHETEESGGLFDVGAGWMYFPRRMWSGPTLELGAFRRAAHTHDVDESRESVVVDHDTTSYAGRALVGWSWYLGERFFIATALGASLGYTSGTGATQTSVMAPSVPYSIGKVEGAFECYTRVGFSYGF